ncbi:MAG: iron-containing alcohol dehydrogenase [Thermomicrobiales bacterium]|nr:iron-containing alcohol dehydrogenase [Thermomicrobiales bacterium]
MVWDSVHPFECPTRVFFGWGAAGQVGERLKELGVSKALIVSDPGIEKAGHVATVASAIEDAGIGVASYTGVQPNPTVGNVEAGYAVYVTQQCDGIVGLGGGSAMDAAKGVGVVAANGGNIADYTGREQIPFDLPPLVCLPTTCGTGSEVTFNAVITDETRHIKLPYVSRKLAPRVALVDPNLVVGAPAGVISSTAADALSHAIECYINTASDPLIDALTIGAIRMIGQNLAAAVNERDRAAIAQLSLASTMAGIAFNMNANAVVHAASTPVTARHDVPHGVANAIFLPAGLRFCIPAAPDRIVEIGRAIGAPIGDLTGEAAADVAVTALEQLFSSVGLPPTLSAFGVDVSKMDLDELAADAMKSRSVPLNPRPITPEDLVALYRKVM